MNIIWDHKLFQKFIETSDGEETNFWGKNLRLKHLNSRLSQIETEFGLDEDTLKSLKLVRRATYSFYSNVVHHSYTSIMMGALSRTEQEKDVLESNLFGSFSLASKSTIETLENSYWYFLMSFVALLIKKIRINLSGADVENWKVSFAFYKIANELFLHKKEMNAKQ